MKLYYLAALSLITISAIAQRPAPTPPTAHKPETVIPKVYPDHTEALLALEKEKTLSLQAQALTQQYQAAMKDAQTRYAELEKQITDWEAKVRAANHWDSSYVYDKSSDTWSLTTPQATATAPAPVK